MPVPTVLIARPGVEHAGEMLTVQRAAYVTEAQRYRAPDIPPLRETLAQLRADLADPCVLVLAAWLGPRLVGSVRGRIAGPELEVARFAVAPDLQGVGVGRRLLAALHVAAPATIETSWLVTGARSVENIRFYSAAGYASIRATTDPAGVDLLRMERYVKLPSRTP